MHQQLKVLHDKLQTEVEKFYVKNNKAAGTRARMLCQEIKGLLNELRKDIQKTKEEMKDHE